MAFIDGSRLITEACVLAGAQVFVGYPITPANLLYSYANLRYPIMMAAPDEITTLQWMSGYATLGKIPVTATSFPGYALMIESINMAAMMELPMVIILVQRLGPATGTATSGAMGDLNVIHGTMSGGFQIPTFCISNMADCWDLSAKAVETAIKLRTPVVLLTSKEMVMTSVSFDMNQLSEINATTLQLYEGDATFKPYAPNAETLVPDFLPVNQNAHQVRFTASTHNQAGILQNTSAEALGNSYRLKHKIDKNKQSILLFDYDKQENATNIVLSFDITAQAAREAVARLRENGEKVSLLIAKSIFPIPDVYHTILEKYKRIIIAEENLDGQYKQLLYGSNPPYYVHGVNAMGKMIHPEEIMKEVQNNG